MSSSVGDLHSAAAVARELGPLRHAPPFAEMESLLLKISHRCKEGQVLPGVACLPGAVQSDVPCAGTK